MNIPDHEGFFWGRWHTPAPGTADNGEMCAGDEWEVHFVFEAGLGFSGPRGEDLAVFVPGVQAAQPLDAFEWGEEVPRPGCAEAG